MPDPRWFNPGDEAFDPASLPTERDGAASVVHNGRLYLLGGYGPGYGSELDSVISYSPATNDWQTHEDLDSEVSFYVTAASDGSHIYALRPNGNLIRYDPSSGETDLGASGVVGGHPVVIVDDRVYCGLTSPTPRYYDITAGTWHDAPGVSPFGINEEYGLALAWRGTIIVVPPMSEETWAYAPDRGSWSRLPDLPEPVLYSLLLEYRDEVNIIAGHSPGGGSGVVWVLTRDRSAWVEAEDDELPVSIAGHAGGTVLGRLVIAGGYDYDEDDITTDVRMFGEPLNVLEGIVSVPLFPMSTTGEAAIIATVDVVGGPGRAAELPIVLMTGGHQVEAQADINVDVVGPTAIIPPITDPGDPPGGDDDTIADPGDGEWEGDIELDEDERLTSTYSMNHSLGGGATGRAESPYKGEFYVPAHVPMPPVLVANAGYSWTQGGDILYRRAFADVAAEEALGTTILGELMPLDQIRAWRAGESPICLFPLDADLCEGVGASDPGSGVMPGPKDPFLPTRLQLAQQAASEAGVGLVLYDGPGLWAVRRRVPIEYRTEGKTAMQVVQEMLLVSNPRYWYSMLSMHVDGRVLPAATGASAGDHWGGAPGDPGGPDGHPPDTSGDGDGDGEGGPPPELGPQPVGLEGEGSIVHDRGMRPVRELRFVSSQSQGFMTPAQVRGMMELYESGAAFELETDLLVPLGEPARTYTVRFKSDDVPVFTPATPKGDLYYFDVLLLVGEPEEV